MRDSKWKTKTKIAAQNLNAKAAIKLFSLMNITAALISSKLTIATFNAIAVRIANINAHKTSEGFKVLSNIVAILYALACPTCEPVLQAVYVSDSGSSICQSTADSLNAERTLPTDPRFYCDE